MNGTHSAAVAALAVSVIASVAPWSSLGVPMIDWPSPPAVAEWMTASQV